MDEDKISELKIKINQFIWENAPSEMTLEDAEKAARALLEAMHPGQGDVELMQYAEEVVSGLSG